MASAEAFAFLVAPMWTMLSIVTEGSGNSTRIRGHGLAYAAVVFVVVVVALGCRCSGGGAGRSWTRSVMADDEQKVVAEGVALSCKKVAV